MLQRSLIALATLLATVNGQCDRRSPAFPRPYLKANDPVLNPLIEKLDSIITNLETNDAIAGWQTNITSFSIQLTSSEETIWSHNHIAPVIGNYSHAAPSAITGDTAFRIASISKTFTVYALLVAGVNFQLPISDFIPELLEDNTGGVDWEEISLQSLASQLSGIPREYGQQDLFVDTSLLADPLAAGLPPISDEDIPLCGKTRDDVTCTRDVYLRGLKTRSPVYAPNFVSTYSNVAFTLLGLALENATGKPFIEALNDNVLKPLGMAHTGVTKPADHEGIIPLGPNDWATVLGVNNPSGGVYSTTNDLARYIRSVLTHKLLSVSRVNAWLKPHSFEPGLNSSYGMPWEIYRTTQLSSDGRGTDIFTKAGALEGYYSIIMIIPEFNLGLTILVAGDNAAQAALQKNVLKTAIPAIETLAREKTKQQYSGFYRASGMNSSLTLEVDETAGGIRISRWISNGTDFLPVYGSLRNNPDGRIKDDDRDWLKGYDARLFPTALRKGSHGEAWRLHVWQQQVDPTIQNMCLNDDDSLMYGNRALQEFVFIRDGAGNIEGVELPAFRVYLEKQKEQRTVMEHLWDNGMKVLGF